MDEEIDEIGYEGVAEGYDSVSAAWDAAIGERDSGVMAIYLPEFGGCPVPREGGAWSNLSSWAKWVAQDLDGGWCEYSHMPAIAKNGRSWDIVDMGHDSSFLWFTRKENIYWKDSLMWVWGETKEE